MLGLFIGGLIINGSGREDTMVSHQTWLRKISVILNAQWNQDVITQSSTQKYVLPCHIQCSPSTGRLVNVVYCWGRNFFLAILNRNYCCQSRFILHGDVRDKKEECEGEIVLPCKIYSNPRKYTKSIIVRLLFFTFSSWSQLACSYKRKEYMYKSNAHLVFQS